MTVDEIVAQIEANMVSIPGGSYLMGSPDNEPERANNEGPQQELTVPSFLMSKTEVTFEQWDACVADGGCNHKPDDEGWGRGSRPVINVSYDDITQQFIPWLNRKTGKTYRLPSEGEWEYAARAGTTTRFHTGDCITTAQANFNGTNPAQGCPRGEYRQKTVPVGSFPSNAFGLHDMHGNVWEWMEDCSNDRLTGMPQNGAARYNIDVERRVLRGGCWGSDSKYLRSAYRGNNGRGHRNGGSGFRLARDE
jgi:formylglycine-generating enzyme required for sulfatase activity